MTRQFPTGLVLLAGTAVAVCLAIGGEGAMGRGGGFGGFHGGGFGGDRAGNFGGYSHWGGYHGGAPRFGDGGFDDRSTDAGFGRGGYGSVHDASTFDDHADTYRQNHPEYQQGQFQQNHPEARQNAGQYQQNRFNEANTLQQNASRYNEARSLQVNRQVYNNNWNHWAGDWGGYYSGAGFGAGLAVGMTMMALKGKTYFAFGGAYYQPFYSGSSVVYLVVANPA